MQRPTSVVDPTPIRFVIVTLDNHLASATDRARATLRRDLPGLHLTMHAAAEWGENPGALETCKADIATADIVVVTMLFVDEHVEAIMPALQARRDHCDAMIACMSAGKVSKMTRMGSFKMDGSSGGGALAFLKKLKPKSSENASAGAKQLAMLRRLPQILRFIPGAAQDVRAYFLTLQYWLSGSEENVVNLVRFLVGRYAGGPRKGLNGKLKSELPTEYPDVGVYHPRASQKFMTDAAKLPRPGGRIKGTIGLLVMRSYVLAGNSDHYDGVISALETRGYAVIPAYASGLDARAAVEEYFLKDGKPVIDALVSLTGFSLVGGPAYNDAKAAEEMLAKLDVPYVAAHAIEFQTLEQWQESDRGLLPIETTIMVAIPEIDGSTGPILFGGRSGNAPAERARDMRGHLERTQMLAARVDRLVSLRKAALKDRKVAIVMFCFPPNAGTVGTAAYLSVFESIHRTMKAMQAEGYTIEVPATTDELRKRILEGNAGRFGQPANVFTRIPADDHVRREKYLREIEAQWGPAPGRQQSDGQNLLMLGERFGNVLVAIQPSFGYEGDPMRLLFERGFAPTHAFSAFYRYLREDFAAHAVLHFGTHGALEFMPGKQAGMSAECWPDRLIGDLPNIYLYAANNPSEGTIAKRRAAATLVSYLTPPISHAGLYRGLIDLKASLDQWRAMSPEDVSQRDGMISILQSQAAAVDLARAEPAWSETEAHAEIARLIGAVVELEYTLIPNGLHVLGGVDNAQERADLLLAIAESSHSARPERSAIETIVAGGSVEDAIQMTVSKSADAKTITMFEELLRTDRVLQEDHETPALMRALDGRFIRPAPGGDVLRSPSVVPTGRNTHGFDPFRIPSFFAMEDGMRQTARLVARHAEDGNPLPETVAIILWGTDNLKTAGGPIAQALALLGARPRFDQYGRLTGAQLIPLGELKRPRIDVLITLSGIFRDLLPLQTRMLAEATYLAASADEPEDQNFVRKHAMAHMAETGCDMETAALRVFSNADGAYGSNVNNLIESGAWQDEDELAETYTRRKSFAYGRSGKPMHQAVLLTSMLKSVDLAYQNLESVELGVTAVDQYFDSLGGISRAVRRAKGGKAIPVYIGDQTRGEGTVRTLGEQVALETRTRMLNPKWYEGMLKSGYEGVRQIELHLTNTMGWSATTGEVAPWVYQQITQTFMLDPEMRERLAALNPTATAKVANRLLEAHERNYWTPDAKMLEALRAAGEDLEDRLEGVGVTAAA